MTFHCIFLYMVLQTVVKASSEEIDPRNFDDSILFDIKWGDETYAHVETPNPEYMFVRSSRQEKYRCVLPNIKEIEVVKLEDYEGPSALELLAPIFSQSVCSYRLESYWTYEICHGRYIRQYHEDREGKKTKLQEYVLGKWDHHLYIDQLQHLRELEKDKDQPVLLKKIENNHLPFLEIRMGNGTLCDLNNNRPRETRILYVCYTHGKHDVYSLKESSTCQYEIVILSPLLCSHPKYRPKDSDEYKINCSPLEGQLRRPYDLIRLKRLSQFNKRRNEFEGLRVEFVPLDLTEKGELPVMQPPPPIPSIIDTTPVRDFLLGKNCLTGGSGWWKYKFCYGQFVEQYHIERDGGRTTINLGTFEVRAHMEWLDQNPQKKPKPVDIRSQLSHLYSSGTICDQTMLPRQTEVKLKCESKDKASAVSIYLLEPKFCEYILVVESPLICEILERADDYGLITVSNVEDDDDDPIISL